MDTGSSAKSDGTREKCAMATDAIKSENRNARKGDSESCSPIADVLRGASHDQSIHLEVEPNPIYCHVYNWPACGNYRNTAA